MLITEPYLKDNILRFPVYHNFGECRLDTIIFELQSKQDIKLTINDLDMGNVNPPNLVKCLNNPPILINNFLELRLESSKPIKGMVHFAVYFNSVIRKRINSHYI